MYIIEKVRNTKNGKLKEGSEVWLLNVDTKESIMEIYNPDKEYYFKEIILGYFGYDMFTVCSYEEYRVLCCLDFKDSNRVGFAVNEPNRKVWDLSIDRHGFALIDCNRAINNNIAAYMLANLNKGVWEVDDNDLYVYYSKGDSLFCLHYEIVDRLDLAILWG